MLIRLGAAWNTSDLFAIEKSDRLRQEHPETIAPVGTEFFEQNLMSLPVDVVFSNPPYSQFAAWATRIIETAHAQRVFLVLPQRWTDDDAIRAALRKRDAKARVIHHDDFLDADRRARAVVDVVEIRFAHDDYRERRQDPFDLWFDQNVDTFDRGEPVSEYEQERQDLARLHRLDSISSLVAAYDEDYARMQENYKAIFRLDYALLKELGVNKTAVRDGLKKRMAGLSNVYWASMFEHLQVITSRLSTKTKARFHARIAKQTSVAFTVSNAYAITLWAIKFANRYFDEQLVDLFRDLSTHDGVMNYTSNQRTWGRDDWRYARWDDSKPRPTHYAVDYRIVKHGYSAIEKESFSRWEHPGGLAKTAHELLDDIIAVFGNLGFRMDDLSSRQRVWRSNNLQTFTMADGRTLFEVRAFMNGNMHFRFAPDAIKALNIEAGRLLGWLRTREDAVTELGCTTDEAARFFGANQQLVPGAVKLLGGAV